MIHSPIIGADCTCLHHFALLSYSKYGEMTPYAIDHDQPFWVVSLKNDTDRDRQSTSKSQLICLITPIDINLYEMKAETIKSGSYILSVI